MVATSLLKEPMKPRCTMEKVVKARKEHTCISCERVIKIGELYLFGKEREPRFSKEDYYALQIGIEYVQWRLCALCVGDDDSDIEMQ